MYSNYILEKFQNPKHAGGLRGADATGKAGDEACGNIVKIYFQVDEKEVITTARFKVYGGVVAIAASDEACEMLVGKSLEEALALSASEILEKLGEIPENKEYAVTLTEEAIKNAVEDYYKKKEKESK